VIRGSNMDVGGRTVELSEFEFIVRGRGYLKSIADLSSVVLKVENGTPVLLKDVARVSSGPTSARHHRTQRRGRSRQRHCRCNASGQNALDVIDNVKARFARWLPASQGVEINSGLRPLQPDHRCDRDLEANADRGKHRRRAGLRCLFAACAQRPCRHSHASRRHFDVVAAMKAWGWVRTS